MTIEGSGSGRPKKHVDPVAPDPEHGFIWKFSLIFPQKHQPRMSQTCLSSLSLLLLLLPLLVLYPLHALLFILHLLGYLDQVSNGLQKKIICLHDDRAREIDFVFSFPTVFLYTFLQCCGPVTFWYGSGSSDSPLSNGSGWGSGRPKTYGAYGSGCGSPTLVISHKK